MFELQKKMDYKNNNVASISPTNKKQKTCEFENINVNDDDDSNGDIVSELGMNGMSQQEL